MDKKKGKYSANVPLLFSRLHDQVEEVVRVAEVLRHPLQRGVVRGPDALRGNSRESFGIELEGNGPASTRAMRNRLVVL